MSLAEQLPRGPLVTKDGKPIVRAQRDGYRCDWIPGIFGPCREKNIFLDRVIAHAEMVGTITDHDPEERKIQLPKEGSSGKFLTEVFRKLRGLNGDPEELVRIKRGIVVGMFEFVHA